MKRLPPDRLPKGTRLELQVLLKRCQELERARVAMPRYGVAALERVLAYFDAVRAEGRAE